MKEATNKEGNLTLLETKEPIVANAINEAYVSSTSLNGEGCVTNLNALRSLGSNGKEVSCVVQDSKDIGIKFDPESESSFLLSSHSDQVCQTPLNSIVAVMEQEGHQMNANLVRVSEAKVTPGWVDSGMVHEGQDKHKGTEQRGSPATQIKLERVNKGGVKNR